MCFATEDSLWRAAVMLRMAEWRGAFWGWVGLRGQRGASPVLREKEATTVSQFPIPDFQATIGNIGIGNWQHFHIGNNSTS